MKSLEPERHLRRTSPEKGKFRENTKVLATFEERAEPHCLEKRKNGHGPHWKGERVLAKRRDHIGEKPAPNTSPKGKKTKKMESKESRKAVGERPYHSKGKETRNEKRPGERRSIPVRKGKAYKEEK